MCGSQARPSRYFEVTPIFLGLSKRRWLWSVMCGSQTGLSRLLKLLFFVLGFSSLGVQTELSGLLTLHSFFLVQVVWVRKIGNTLLLSPVYHFLVKMCTDQCHPICHWRPHIIQEMFGFTHQDTQSKQPVKSQKNLWCDGVIWGDRCPLRSSQL